MSDWHFGIDYDMWLYPPVDCTAPDYDYDELPEPIEAANIEGTLLVNAEDAIEQVRRLQAENAKLKQELEAVGIAAYLYGRNDLKAENAKLREQLVEESSERVILNDWHFEIADALGIHYEDDNDVDCNDLGENNLNEVKKTIAETNEMILVISDLMNSYADADVPHTNCHKCTASKRCSGSPCILIDDVRRRMIEIGVEV